MSTQSTPESDSSTAATTDQQFSWAQFTLHARGPVERIQHLDEDWTMRAAVEIVLERPLRDRRDFVSVALPASWINGTGFVVGYLLDEIDGHRLSEHEAHEDWTVTIHGDVSDWLDLARAADDDRLGYPLESSSALKILRNVAKAGVADPNALLALVQWAEQRGVDDTRDTWLTEYQERVSADE